MDTDKLLIALILISVCGCSSLQLDSPERLFGAFAAKNGEVVVIFTPRYCISRAAEFVRLYPASKYKFVKKYYHVYRRGRHVVIKTGSAWSEGGVEYAVDSLDKLTTGNFIDRGGTFRRIPVEEAWKLLEKMGYDRKKVEAAPPCTANHADNERKDEIIFYDSIKSRKFSRLDSWARPQEK